MGISLFYAARIDLYNTKTEKEEIWQDAVTYGEGFKRDCIQALQHAIDNNIPIAHYYMARLLEYMPNPDTAKIESHWAAAKRPAGDIPTLFQLYVPQLKYFSKLPDEKKKTEPQTIDQIMEIVDGRGKINYKKFETGKLIRKAEDSTDSVETGKMYFVLGERHYKDGDHNSALKYYLLAACLKNKDAKKSLKAKTGEFPDLYVHIHYLKKALGVAKTT